jgi:hypothetical protein
LKYVTSVITVMPSSRKKYLERETNASESEARDARERLERGK